MNSTPGTPSPLERLERELHGAAAAEPGPDFAAVHRLGSRRRRRRRAGLAAGGLLAGVLVVGSLSVTGVVGTTARDVEPAGAPQPVAPEVMRPLARRALEEVPGAVQVSATQVVLPGDPGMVDQMGDQPVPGDLIETGPVDIGAHSYTGVTAFGRRSFPTWLYDGVERIEQEELADDEGYPVGSTATGILVDAGELRLACMHSLPDWGEDPDAPCFPAMLRGSAETGWSYAWGMGTDDFLDEGKPVELFSTQDYSTGSPREVWIGGTDGTDVATVELVGVDGERAQAQVAAGDLVAGETMFWGALEEDIAVAITRDADGQVLERHEVRPCSGGVDCEVR